LAIRKVDDGQLRFELELDEAEEDALQGSISYEEAQRRSLAARVVWEGRSGKLGVTGFSPDWFVDYLKLVELGWPWRVACYIAWASSPKSARWPETLQELATQVLGLSSPRVVYIWRQKHATIDQVTAMMQAAPLFEHRADVLKTLAEMAKTPDYKNFNDRKLFLEMIGDYVPKSQIDVGRSSKGDEQDLSDEELRIAAGSVSAGASEADPRIPQVDDAD
jgi:hypothetical protein